MPPRSNLFALALLSACKPPATDDYVARVGLDKRDAPGAPIETPDTAGADWAPSREADRIIYGKPGEPALFSLACASERGAARVVFTRHAVADPGAEAVLALIGNGHVKRLWVDATKDGRRWLWRGSLPADSPELEALTGPNRIEATVPGAGSLILNASRAPGELISACRRKATRPPREDGERDQQSEAAPPVDRQARSAGPA